MRAQVVGRWERRSWETSVSERGENEGRQGVREVREAQSTDTVAARTLQNKTKQN